MNFKHIQLIYVFYLINIVSPFAQTPEVWLDELPIRSFSGGIPSVGTNTNQSGDSIKIGGHYFKRGIGVQSTSVISFLLNGHAASFSAMVGVDDKANSELHYNFYVIGDRKILFESKKPDSRICSRAGIRRSDRNKSTGFVGYHFRIDYKQILHQLGHG